MKLTLEPSAVDLWLISLQASQEEIASDRQVLSPDECRRADRFHFADDAKRFVCARARVRTILSHYLGVLPADLEFSYGHHGKPELASSLKSSGIEFNLSHSCGWGLLAVAMQQRVGADIEYVDHTVASEALARRFFAEGEVSRLLALPERKRCHAFISCWTRKEAYIKALGNGFSVPMNSFEMAFGARAGASLFWSAGAGEDWKRWRVYDVKAPRGFKAAVVVEGKTHRLKVGTWKRTERERQDLPIMESRGEA